MKHKFLFNFSASYSGGGFKRLYAYAKWFNQNGGAYFIVNPHCKTLIHEFPQNKFFLIGQSRFERLFNDCDYLKGIKEEIGEPEFYYSYGIPIYQKFGKMNWFHLSNVLPLISGGVPLSLFDKLKLSLLGRRIKDNLKNADIISAESNYSLSLIKPEHAHKFNVSVNGSDDKLSYFDSFDGGKKDNIATVIGTYRYKLLGDSYQIFEMLRETNPDLKLIIIGDATKVPSYLNSNKHVIVTGCIDHAEVINYLRKSEFYISTTSIENSYNAASEGIFFARNSYISDIEPHRELIEGLPFKKVLIPNVKRPVLYLKRDEISPINLKTWEEVIKGMLEHISGNKLN